MGKIVTFPGNMPRKSEFSNTDWFIFEARWFVRCARETLSEILFVVMMFVACGLAVTLVTSLANLAHADEPSQETSSRSCVPTVPDMSESHDDPNALKKPLEGEKPQHDASMIVLIPIGDELKTESALSTREVILKAVIAHAKSSGYAVNGIPVWKIYTAHNECVGQDPIETRVVEAGTAQERIYVRCGRYGFVQNHDFTTVSLLQDVGPVFSPVP